MKSVYHKTFNLPIDSVPDKFYIILSGTVSVFKLRHFSEILEEEKILEKVFSRLSLILKSYNDSKPRDPFVTPTVEKLIKNAKELELSEEELKILENWEQVTLDKKVIYKQEYIQRELSGLDYSSIIRQSVTFNETSGILKLKFLANLKSGLMFGEKGINGRILRNATCMCSSDCDFGIMTAKDYTEVLKDVSIA